MVRLIGGAAQRRAGRLREARVLLDAARGAAARSGEHAMAGHALCELGWVDLAEDQPAAAATCFEFAAEFLRRARQVASLEADTLAVTAWAAAGDHARAALRAGELAGPARRAKRLDLIAFADGALADLALRTTPETATAACALAARSAEGLHDAPELTVQARLRLVRASSDARDRARHLEVGIDLAIALAPDRATARLGGFLFDLLDDAGRLASPPARPEIERLVTAIAGLGDDELTDMAHAVLAGLG